jgi:signal transduction histidine kinase
LALAFGALSLGYAWNVARHLREDARTTSRLLGLVFTGLNDPAPDAASEALLTLAREVRALGVPVAVTDRDDRVTAYANAPPEVELDTARLRAWVRRMDQVNLPLAEPGVGTIHYGAPPIALRFSGLAVIQAVVFLFLAAVTWWALRARESAARDRLWVAMAREAAHQLGTPLMSLTGWIGYLRENLDTAAGELLPHLEADAERLERVARRFERIGRPARREPVGLGAVAERVVAYFRPRLPTLANAIQLELVASGAGPTVLGDPVLIEWALETLVKNAIDALSGRGGRVGLQVDVARATGRVRVTDDGPGVPIEVRARLFEPGTSTKPAGWGIGLAIARRIVEQQHGGRVSYHPEAQGSTFILDFPLSDA